MAWSSGNSARVAMHGTHGRIPERAVDEVKQFFCDVLTITQKSEEASQHDEDVIRIRERLKTLESLNAQQVSQRFAEILACLHQLADMVATGKADLRAVRAEIIQLQIQYAEIREQLNDAGERILLGQVAYRIDDLISEFVFDGVKHLYIPLKNIFDAATNGDLSVQQVERWNLVREFLKRKKYRLVDIQRGQSIVKHQRLTDAHGTEEAKAAANKEKLLLYTEAFAEPSLKYKAVTIVEVLCLLAGEEQPLIAEVDMTHVLHT